MNTRYKKKSIDNYFFTNNEKNQPQPNYIIIPNPAFNIDVEPGNSATTAQAPEENPQTFKFTRP